MAIIQGSGPMAFAMGMAKDFINCWDLMAVGILVTIISGFLYMTLLKIRCGKCTVVKCLVLGCVAILGILLVGMVAFANMQ